MRVFVFVLLMLDLSASPLAAEFCPICPPAYCENVELAERLKTRKKQSAEAQGLPPRLSSLFDRLGNCEGCVKTSPDWPHLVVVYDGDALSDYYGEEIASYTSSRAWSAADEYRARKDMGAGLVSEFHITLGAEPCRCCKAQDVEEYKAWTRANDAAVLGRDPRWDASLRTYQTHTVSVTTIDEAQVTPDDLGDIPPNRQLTVPVPGKLSDYQTVSPARVVQVLCRECQSLADNYNQTGLDINKTNDTLASVQRDLSYEQNMAAYSRAMIDALNAAAGTPRVLAEQKSHGARMQKAFANMKALQTQASRLSDRLGKLRADQASQMSALSECEATQCLPSDPDETTFDFPTTAILVSPGDEPATATQAATINWPDDAPAEHQPRADLPPLEVYWLGEILFGHSPGSECPAAAGVVFIASNNGHPLAVSPIEETGKISEFLDHSISGSNSPAPSITSSYNCESKKPGKLKGSLSTTVTDTVTGETVKLEVPAQGQITKSLKSSSDPNTQFKTDRRGLPVGPGWKRVETKCLACSKIVEQYNQTMERIFRTRKSIQILRHWLDSFRKPGALDWNTGNADAIASFISRIEGFEQLLAEHKAILRELEQQASYLQSVIRDCEQQQCTKKQRSKLSAIDVPGLSKGEYFQPDTGAILDQYGFNWPGPYTSDCLPCRPLIEQLNAIPGWLTRAHQKTAWLEHEIRDWELQASTMGGSTLLDESKEKIPALKQAIADIKKEIAALKNLMRDLQARLTLCQKKYCGKDSKGESRFAMPSAIIGGKALLIDGYSQCSKSSLANPITIGPNNEVGSSAKFKEDATGKAVGAAVNALAGLAGFGGGGGAEKGPTTYKDPIKNRDKTRVKSKKPKREIRVGAGFTDQGLLISNEINKAPGKGTFHSAVLQNDRGWQLLPWKLYLYEIWGEWSLSVSWTRDTFVDGELVKHEEGGWDESWTELLAKGESMTDLEREPLWKRLGFTTATSGAKSVGTLFPVSPAMLAEEPLDLFLHISNPDADPVTTLPYHFRLSLDDKGKILTEHVLPEAHTQPSPCKPGAFLPSGPPEGKIEGEGTTPFESSNYQFDPATLDMPVDAIEFEVDGQHVVGDAPPPKPANTSRADQHDAAEMDEQRVKEIMKDPGKFGRRLTQQEIARLKTKPSAWDRDGDGIQNEADTLPDIPSDAFIAGNTIGRIINPQGQSVKVFGDNGEGIVENSSDGVAIEVGDSADGASPVVEIFGVELELDPGTILEASFG